jgi:transposase-like protein
LGQTGEIEEGQRSDGLTTDERQELARLRRENKRLRLKREILAKATAWSGTSIVNMDIAIPSSVMHEAISISSSQSDQL